MGELNCSSHGCGSCKYMSKSIYAEPCSKCKHCGSGGALNPNCEWRERESESESESVDATQEDNGNAAGAVHYQSGIQPIEFFQSVMGEQQFQGFLQGNVLKYASRLGKKDSALKDAQKIRQYSHWLVLALEGKKIDPRKDVL